MKVIIGADHGGFKLKEYLKEEINKLGYSVSDFGAYSAEPVDYPDIALLVAEQVASSSDTVGIIIDGAGIGSCMAANKVSGIRAACCNELFLARNSKEHNDANILTLGGRIIGEGLALEIVKIWLESKFQQGRHTRRVDKIMQIEKKYFR